MNEDALYRQQRPRLFGLAYRLTGSVSAAEDIVQEACLRLHRQVSGQAGTPHSIETPAAWLTTVTTRLALDYNKSAAVQRSTYIGPWLPEPLVDDRNNPQALHELDQSVTTALLVVLDALSPAERAAFILHDLFQFSFDEISTMLGNTPPACRKLASRARARIGEQPTVSSVPRQQHTSIVQAFFNALRSADTEALANLLCEDVKFHADGGGKVPAARQVLEGRPRVLRFLQRAVFHTFSTASKPGQPPSGQLIRFNGAPGLLISQQGTPLTAFSFVVAPQGIRRIYALRNPDKLQVLGAQVTPGVH